MKRKWFRLPDLVLLAGVLLVSLTLFLILRTSDAGEMVQVYEADALVTEVSLPSVTEPYYHTIETENGALTLLFERDGVSVTHADCPDKTCVRTGKITRCGESIVCVPLGVCITFADAGDVDGVTG